MVSFSQCVLVLFICLHPTAETVPVGNERYPRSPWTEDLIPDDSVGTFRHTRWQDLQRSTHYEDGQQLYSAVTFGQGHVITFDGKYYHFPEHLGTECPHILTSDHREYTFMVLRSSQSITVFTPHTVITVHSNNKVEVNNTGSFRDLPVQSWDNAVSVTHDNRAVVIKTNTGMTVKCDINHEECLYLLEGSYVDRTIGLLGTNDNDPSNDFLLRSGVVAQTAEEFVNYYELTGLRSCRTQAPVAPPTTCSSHLSSKCHQLFRESSSPLASCFSTVNTDGFMEACRHDTESCYLSNKGTAICDTVSAYTKMCEAHGVHTATPGECGKCGEHKLGSSWMQRSHKKVDVVIATSLNSALMPSNRNLGNMLQHTVNSMESYLRKKGGIHNIRMGLLGFDGEDNLKQPHVYTMQGLPFARHYNAAIWRETLQSLLSNGNTMTDPVQVIDSALRYPMRSDAVKVILLVTDSLKSTDQSEVESLKQRLQSQGVGLFVVTRAYPELQSDKVQGILANSQLLTRTDGQDYGHPMYSTNFPNDNLGQLIQATNGAIFDLDDVVVSNSDIHIHIGEQILNRIVRESQRCRECRCAVGTTVGTTGSPVSVCDVHHCA